MSPEFAELARIYATGSGATILAAAATMIWARKHETPCLESFAPTIAAAVAVFYGGALLWMGWGKAMALNHYADRATHLEILWRSTNGMGLTSLMSADYHTGEHWFAAHFTPIVYIAYWPFFKILPGHFTLHILQTAYLMSACVPVGLVAERHLGRGSAWLFSAAFLLYPTVQYVNLYGTAYIDLSIPLLAWAIFGLDSRRTWLFLLACGLALTTREDTALVVCSLGCYATLRERARTGAVVAVGALAYFVFVVGVVIPSYRSDSSLVYMSNYAEWGASPQEILRNAIMQPLMTAERLFTLTRVGNAFMYLLPLGFLSLLDPLTLLVSAPNVLTTFMSGHVSNYNYTLYYLSPTIPILFLSAIRGAKWMQVRGRFHSRTAGAATAFVAALTSSVFFGPTPVSLQFWQQDYEVGIFHTTSYHRSQYTPDQAALDARKVSAAVPMSATVSAEQHLLPLLYDRHRIQVFPTVDDSTEYVVIDRAKTEKAGFGATYLTFREDPERYYARLDNSGEWEQVMAEGRAELYRRLATAAGPHGTAGRPY